MGFARAHEVEAVTAIPPFDAAEKLDFIWHDVIHAAIALDRARPWRAFWYVERLRNGALELAAGRVGLDLRHFKDADRPELSDKVEPKLSRFLDLIEHNRRGGTHDVDSQRD